MKFLLIFAAVAFLFSCSDTPEKIKEDVNKLYLDQAQVFIQSKLDELNKDQEVKITNFTNLKIDSSFILSSNGLEISKMQPLIAEFRVEKEYLDKLIAIDEAYGVRPDDVTKTALAKCQSIVDSMQRWEKRTEKLSKKDTLGYGIRFSYDLKQSDGASLKDRVFFIYFDKNHDINDDWNK